MHLLLHSKTFLHQNVIKGTDILSYLGLIKKHNTNVTHDLQLTQQ